MVTFIVYIMICHHTKRPYLQDGKLAIRDVVEVAGASLTVLDVEGSVVLDVEGIVVLDMEGIVVLDMEGFGGEFVPDMGKIAAWMFVLEVVEMAVASSVVLDMEIAVWEHYMENIVGSLALDTDDVVEVFVLGMGNSSAWVDVENILDMKGELVVQEVVEAWMVQDLISNL